MDSTTQARYQARADIMKALAHPTRLFLVDELARNGERCVCKLTELVGADMSTVSKHLAILKKAGIVCDRRRGSMIYYRVCVPCVSEFFGCVESVMKCNVKQQETLLCRRS